MRPPPTPRVLLVQMPWASPTRPSIALGILTRLCQEAGVTTDCQYPNMDLWAAAGARAAETFAEHRGLFGLSEHLFAVDLFGAAALTSDELLATFAPVADLPALARDTDWLRRVRDQVIPDFMARTVARILAWQPTVVGFTAMFNQVMPSLALAARLKAARPELRIICGGASFDDEMGREYHRALPGVVDHVFMAEAEEAFRIFLARLQAGEPTTGIPGVTWWTGDRVELIKGEPLADMERSPMPDYDAYFGELARVEREQGLRFNLDRLPFESSRGCWWGEKNHCVFCGLNPEVLPFRAKSSARTVAELTTLASRHRVGRFIATDWIVSREHRGAIFRELAERGGELEIFYETRADMSKAEVAAMKDAGVTRVQPGIESFSTPLLRLMRKHSQGIRQVQFLRWCLELGVHPVYHLLAGFPGEQPGWFADMVQLVPRLRHLVPPRHNVFTVELHRFSPMFNRRADYGIVDVDIRVDYRFNFPEGTVDLDKVGYFFDFRSEQLGDVDAYLAPLRDVVADWMQAHERAERPQLEYQLIADFLLVVDTRDGGWRERALVGLQRDVLLLCDEVTSRRALARDLATCRAPGVLADLDAAVDELVGAGLLLQEGEHLLSLPTGRRPRSTEALRELVLGPGSTVRRAPLAVVG